MAGGGEKPKRNLSPEERQRRSELARRLHQERIVDPETGEERPKFGGRQPRVEVKKTSDDLIQSIVDATKGDDVQELVIRAYVQALQEGSRAEKLRAAKGIVEILEGHKKQQLAERRALDEHKRNELLGGILRDLGVGSADGEEVLDGEFSVLDDGRAGRHPGGVPELESGEGAAD